jgi:hypothetical protein
MFGTSHTEIFTLGGPSKLHSAKSLEGISLCNACFQKRKYEQKNLACTLLIRPVLENESACWDRCRGQIRV